MGGPQAYGRSKRWCSYHCANSLKLTCYADLIRDGFGEECYFKALLVELKSSPSSAVSSPSPSSSSKERDERIIGYVLYFYTYSTWEGRAMFMEDLFVREQYRSKQEGATGCVFTALNLLR